MWNLPITDPVTKLTILLAAILLAPVLARLLKLPGIIGWIVAGILLGPHTFGILQRDARVEIFAVMGLLYIMFVAGAEVDMNEFRQSRRRAAVFGALTFLIPQVVGTLVGVWWLGFSWLTSILLASMFASHTLVAYPILSGLSLAKKEVVVVGLGGTIITDTLALLVLAVIAAMAKGRITPLFWGQILLAILVVGPGVLLLLPLLGRWAFRKIGGEGTAQFLFVMLMFFFCAFLAHVMGLEPIIGAFFAGLALNRLIPENSTLMNRVQFFGNSFFIPLFLISVGMLVDVRRMVSDPASWETAGAMVLVALLAKFAAARLTRWCFGYTRQEGYVLYSLSVAQAAATMAAVLVGYRLGIFNDSVVNGTILMILVTCLAAPWLADRFGRQMALAEAQRATPSRSRFQRFLVAVARGGSAESLLELAFLFRKNQKTDEPIHVLRVVNESGDEQAAVARAEGLLGACLASGAAAEVPVNPVIRLDLNIAEGVARAARELRATTILFGWKGYSSAGDRIFGSVFDQILETCPHRLLACRFENNLTTAKRMTLLLPPLARYDRQFDANLENVKGLARTLSLPLHVLYSPDDDVEDHIRRIPPKLEPTFGDIRAWNQSDWFANNLRAGDLFVIFSARAGSVSWRPWLNRLPGRIAEQYPHAPMILLYPAQTFEEPEGLPSLPRERDILLDSVPDPEGMVLGLDGVSFDDAIQTMLRAAIPNSGVIDAVHRSLRDIARDYTPEISPGVVLLHTHDTPLPQPKVLVGISRSGLELPGARQPIGLIFIILGTPERLADTHLQLMAAIAQRVQTHGWVEMMRACSSPMDARNLLAVKI